MPENAAATNGDGPTTTTDTAAADGTPAGQPAPEMQENTAPAPLRTAGVADAWTAVAHDVRSLTIELAEVGIGVARQLSRPPEIPRPSFSVPNIPIPALPQLQNRWSRAQDAVAREVKTRLDRLEEEPVHPHAARSADWRSPADLLDDLLTTDSATGPESARTELYRALLLRLVPDEARLLAALAGGASYPLVHVQAKTRTVLANASTLGEVAQLAVPDAAGIYVAHLLALGLAEEGPEDESLAAQYDVLIGGSTVRAAEEVARVEGRLGSRVLRRTLRISPLGRSLWTDCRSPVAS